MGQMFYRVTLVHVEGSGVKTRLKNLGEICKFESDSAKEVQKEIKRLQDMTTRASWQIPTKILVERAEMSDYVEVTLDELELPPIKSQQEQIDEAVANFNQS